MGFIFPKVYFSEHEAFLMSSIKFQSPMFFKKLYFYRLFLRASQFTLAYKGFEKSCDELVNFAYPTLSQYSAMETSFM